MKRSQRIILSLGLVILMASALFPPWYALHKRGIRSERICIRRFFALRYVRAVRCRSSPGRVSWHTAELDIPRMHGEWVIIGSATALGVLLAPQVLSIPGAIVAQRRRKRGQCLSCGYNLTGNASGVCPECGRKIKPLTEED